MSDSNDWVPWSWSPGGRKLAGYNARAGATNGIFVYSFESQRYEKLTDFGLMPVWLSDSRRMLFEDRGRLYVVDSQSKKVHAVLSVAPYDFGYGVTLSHDDRLIYFRLVSVEADGHLADDPGIKQRKCIDNNRGGFAGPSSSRQSA
jgi:hypothetical protein